MSRPDRDARARHLPVMLARCVELLAPALDAPGALAVDATLGLGGHSEALLETCRQAQLIGIDRDPQALQAAVRRLAGFGDRVRFAQARYDELPSVLAGFGISEVAAVLMDLGVSSLQLDQAERGFAYAADTPLDMRMDQTTGPTAADIVNSYPVEALARVLRQYGEERFAGRIAAAIVRERDREPFTRSGRLVSLIRDTIPAATRRTGGNPAKRTFQALRIEVNGELDSLTRALPAAVDALALGGRIVVLAYHSLEDRMVKQVLAEGARSTAPPGLPVELAEHAPRLRLLTRGAQTPEPAEVELNPRAASARLRAAERVRAGRVGPAGMLRRGGGQPRSGRRSSGRERGGDAA